MPIPKPHVLAKRNHGCRLETELTLWGHRAVVLQNELLRVTVLAGKGADVVEFLYKPLDVDFLWANPTGPRPVETSYPPTSPEKCFGDYYFGGWQELFPHGSLPEKVDGGMMYQHGEVWGLPWEVRVEEDTPERVSVTFHVRTRKMPLVLERRMTLESGSPVVTLDETAHNLSGHKIGVIWGHHPAFGAPFLSGDCTLYAPAKTVNVNLKAQTSWPKGKLDGKPYDFGAMPPEGSRIGRMLYLENLSDGWYALVNAKKKIGFGMRWDAKRFPVVWIWQETNAGTGSPWYGEAYAMAVEPVSHLPFPRERKEALLEIPARGTVSTRIQAFAIPGGKPVKAIDAQCRAK